MRRYLFASLFALSLISGASAQSISTGSSSTPNANSWVSYGENEQHTALYTGASQTVRNIHWQASLDDDRSYYGSEVLIHYASPVVTLDNTVVHSYRYTTSSNGTPFYDNWEVMGRNGATGELLWKMNSDYSAPVLWPTDWTSVYPLCLVNVKSFTTISLGGLRVAFPSTSTGVAAGGSGGTVLVRSSADTTLPTLSRIAFYTTLKDYNSNAAAYAPIKINTPLTADTAGNVYFGYIVTGTLPSNLSKLGTGGLAKVNPTTGATSYVSVESLKINSDLGQPAMNAAPAVSSDGQYIYFALAPSGGGSAYLAKLTSSSLTPVASVALMDPSVPGGPAQFINESSASPMVGPDGHVFMGVFGNGWRESHGWMLQFDGNLKQTNANGTLYPIGAFGWDDTASVVPSTIVPSYKGKASYLILTKYNNYDDNGSDPGANGSNHVAVLDPTNNSTSKDRQSGIPVMNEVLLVLSPTLDPTSQYPNARTEWCINSSAVDVAKKSAIINCEDGHVYRWSFVTNTLTEALDLQPATGEAYTSTVIGTDGTIYAINNSILFAVGN